MKRIDKTFRLTKICKITASVGVCGFLLSSGVYAEVLSSGSVNGLNVKDVQSATYSGSGLGVVVFYQNDQGTSQDDTTGVTITLSNGADLTGLSPTGGSFAAIYSQEMADSTDNAVDSFTFAGSSSSLLVLQGNNTIGGDVGYHLEFSLESDPIIYGTVTADAIDTVEVNGDVEFNGKVNATRIDILSGAADVQFGDLVDKNGINDITGTVLDFNGYNASITLSDGVILNGSIINKGGTSDAESPEGDRTNGSLVFLGDGTVTGVIGDSTSGLSLIQFDGSADQVSLGGNVTANQLNYGAASTVTITGDLLMTPDASPAQVLGVTFSDKAGSLEIIGGDLTGLADQTVVSNSTDNRGTLTFTGDSDGDSASIAQTVTGHIGESGESIQTLNVGGTSTNNSAIVTIDGNVFANSVRLRNDNSGSPFDSGLTLSTGRNLTGTVTTDVNGMGDLTLAGGTQMVTGTIGADGAKLDTVSSGATDATSTFTGAIHATNVENSGTGTSTYQADVTATNVDVLAGTSNFATNLTATTTTISSGTGNFNTDDTSTTTSAVSFSGTGTANLHTGLTGTIDFTTYDGRVNLWDGQTISGNITGTSTGNLNVLGAGTLDGSVAIISELNVNRVVADAVGDTLDATSKTLVASQSVSALNIKLFNDGELELAGSKNLTATNGLTTTTDNTGVLTALGTSTVTGNVGAAGTALKTISAGTTGETVTFEGGVSYATTLAYSGNGTVRVNGSSPTGASVTDGALTSGGEDLGFVGTVDFGDNETSTGTFELGDNVDLITQHLESPTANTQTAFTDANGATLRFSGSSVVSGDLGSGTVLNGAINTIGADTFGTIYAGAASETVTFLNDVYVSADTFHVSATGTVNFVGDLNGPLIYDADGVVNVANGKTINGSVTTATTNTGTLNFVGGTTTQADIGSSSVLLKEVNFHEASSDSMALPVTPADVSVNIGHNVYATDTQIGTTQNSNADATVANVTANVFLGQNVTLTSSNVTLNTAGTVTTATQGAVDAGTAISLVDFAHTKLANGTLANTATVTRSTFGAPGSGTGGISTNGATLNFAVATTDWSSNKGGTVDTTTSSRITGDSGSRLILNGNEVVNLSLLGSLRDGEDYTLIDIVGEFENTDLPSTLRDNSYVITTTLSRSNDNTDAVADGDLLMTATRANDVYITASGTTGHFSNDAALRLGTLARAGESYDEDMQTVLNQLDIDQWGYGNNEANLAVQAQRLAPIANNSFGLSAFRTASLMNDSIGMRMHEMRIPEPGTDPDAVWIRSVFQHGEMGAITNDADVTYDGFETQISGVTLGLDARPSEHSLLGVAASYSTTEIDQQNFRNGEDASISAVHASLYGAIDLTPKLLLDATITGSWNGTEGNRATAVGRTAQYDIDSDQLTGKVNLGYRIPLGESGATLTPLLSYEASQYNQDAYVETGAGDIGLSVNEQKLSWNQAALGFRLAGTAMWGGMVAKPELTVMATQESGNFAKPIVAQYIGDNTQQASFTTQMLDEKEYDEGGIKASIGLGLLMSKTSSMNVRLEHNQNDDYESSQLDLFVRWDF